MEFIFPKKQINYLAQGLREVQTQELTQELRLSDGMPDVGRILSAWGQVVLRGKEWRSRGISISGGVMIWVLYAPEDGTQVRTMESWIPFQMNWDLGDEPREGTIQVQNLLRYVDARSTSARKILVRAGIGSLGEALVPRETAYAVPGEVPEGVQVRTGTYPIRLNREAGEKSFLLDEELTLPDSAPDPEKLIYYTVNPGIQEQKISGDKVIFRGCGNLHLLYLSQEGQLHSWDFEVPFSQYSDLENAPGTDAQVQVTPCVTSLELEVDDENRLRLKCGMLGQYLVSDRTLLEIPEDAYSTDGPSRVEMENLELPAILEQKNLSVPMAQELHNKADIPVDTVFLPDFPRQQHSWDSRNWQLQGQFKCLYYGEDRAIQASTARWEGTVDIPAEEDTQMYAQVMPAPRPQATATAESISINGEFPLLLQSQSRRGIPMVSAMDLQKEEGCEDRPSLILRRAGTGELWDLAKLAGSTVETIKSANHLEGEPEADRMLLVPVK